MYIYILKIVNINIMRVIVIKLIWLVSTRIFKFDLIEKKIAALKFTKLYIYNLNVYNFQAVVRRPDQRSDGTEF